MFLLLKIIIVTSLCLTSDYIYTGGADASLHRTPIPSLLDSQDPKSKLILQIEDVKGFGCLEYNSDRKIIIAGGWTGV